MDAICLDGLSFYGYHGVHQSERALGQRFTVDLRLEVDLRPAGRTDELERTVDYAQVWELVRAIVEGPPSSLIEAVGERIADGVLATFAPVRVVWVRVGKPWAPIQGSDVGGVAIELTRERAGTGGSR